MKEELESILVSKYPELCQDYRGDHTKTCFARGFECGDGWFELIDSTFWSIKTLAEQVQLNVKIAQIKSKFGHLTIYLEIEPGLNNPKIQQAIQQINFIVENAKEISKSMSEISGKKASPKIINHTIFVVTEEEATQIESGIIHEI